MESRVMACKPTMVNQNFTNKNGAHIVHPVLLVGQLAGMDSLTGNNGEIFQHAKKRKYI